VDVKRDDCHNYSVLSVLSKVHLRRSLFKYKILFKNMPLFEIPNQIHFRKCILNTNYDSYFKCFLWHLFVVFAANTTNATKYLCFKYRPYCML